MATEYIPNRDSPTFCILSHTSLAMQNEGDLCVCNKNTESLKDNNHNVIYLNRDGIQSAWNSYTRKMIMAGLDHGRKLPSCQACWDDEAAGKISSRQQFNQRLANVNPTKSQPKILIIKPTNICNFGCRTCQPNTSTSLYQDFFELDTQRKYFSGSLKEYTQQFKRIRDGFDSDNEKIWPVLKAWSSDLILIDIYGGEPMLAPAMWDTLESAVQNNFSKNIDIQFHTNISIWNDHYINLLPAFKSVNVGLSLDSDDPNELEYIRHNSVVSKIKENINRYIELSAQHSNISLMITLTVSIYNIWNLNRIINNLKDYKIPIGINIVYAPTHYDIRHLPIPVKNKLIDKFKNNSDLQSVVKILSHTIPGCDIEWPKFCQEVDILDKIRNQSFRETFPEFWNELVPFWV
jgi:sulfatase maturation enzyme AslB (radical SAM superfamily)